MSKCIIIFFTVLILLPGCVYAVRVDGPYEGKVIDADTGEPIEGVVILGVWYTSQFSPAGGVSNFYDARETMTDKNGEFSIPGMGLRVLSNLQPMDALIFKAGYEYIGLGPWESLKKAMFLKEKIKWEGDKPIIPLRKLTMEERKKQGDPDYPSEASKEKIKFMLNEVNKDRTERGLKPVN